MNIDFIVDLFFFNELTQRLSFPKTKKKSNEMIIIECVAIISTAIE